MLMEVTVSLGVGGIARGGRLQGGVGYAYVAMFGSSKDNG